DEVRETQHRHADVRTTPAESADVAFDLDGILRVASTWQATCFGVLGEHRRTAGLRAVYRGRRLHDQAAHRLRLLASGEQLHCPDDVEFLHRGTPTRAARSRGDGGVHDSVDVGVRYHPSNQGIADVRSNEFG